MNKFLQLFFGNKPKDLPSINTHTIEEAVKPSDDVINSVLDESFRGMIARQWVNWAAEQIGEDKKYYYGYPMSIKSLWVFYEGCRVYSENKGRDIE